VLQVNSLLVTLPVFLVANQQASQQLNLSVHLLLYHRISRLRIQQHNQVHNQQECLPVFLVAILLASLPLAHLYQKVLNELIVRPPNQQSIPRPIHQ
jgi:hypothetical protein